MVGIAACCKMVYNDSQIRLSIDKYCENAQEAAINRKEWEEKLFVAE